MAMIEDFLSGKLWKPYNFTEFEIIETNKLEPQEKAVIVLPARHHKGLEKQVNNELKKINKVVLILCGDEEAEFNVSEIDHNNIQIWVMNPHMDCKFNKLGTGYSPHVANYPLRQAKKDIDLFFSGQITHKRRSEMWRALNQIKENVSLSINKTKGFTQGLSQADYSDKLARSKVAPAPSGAEIPDSFRLWEALELMSFVIADQKNSQGTINNYWDWFFEETPPFYLINDWNDLPSYTDKALSDWDNNIIRQTCWWYKYKRDLSYKIMNFLDYKPSQDITIIIPSSPIKSHPSTDILEETIKSIKYHLPNAEIIITFDGVRKEQADRTDDYKKHIIDFLKSIKGKNILPVFFEEHQHQSGMLKQVLKYVKTPLVMYVEHDTPLIEKEIDFKKIIDFIYAGEATTVRFHHEDVIPEEHKPLMIGEKDGFIKTIQWSQRPHITTKQYLQEIADYFKEEDKSFIEDIWHGVVYNDCQTRLGWFKHRLWIYAPKGGLKRSYHTDGRGDEQKYKQGWEK